MISDDTEHTIFVAQSLLVHPHSPREFSKRLAWALRGWLLSLPAGVGWATLRAIGKLWCGVPPDRSGVFSAGNGPAMRVAPIGAFFSDSPEQLDAYVGVSTRLTHRDPRALVGATAVALLVAWCIREGLRDRPSPERFAAVLRSAGPEDAEWMALVTQLKGAAEEGLSVEAFADRLGLERGITGYVYHSVPVAAYAWFRHFGDFRASLESALGCGGDTDTVGAIVGALAGAAVGESGIPSEWIAGITDWPRGRKLLTRIADRLTRAAEGGPAAAVRYCWLASIPRNLVFLALVLAHGLRRLGAPY